MTVEEVSNVQKLSVTTDEHGVNDDSGLRFRGQTKNIERR